MVQEPRRFGASEQPGQGDLTARGFEQIFAPNDVRDAVIEIIDRRGELIRPVAFPIADEKIAALLRRPLLLWTAAQIDETFDRRIQSYAQAHARCVGESAIATCSCVAKLANLAPGTRTRVNQSLRAQVLEGALVRVRSRALSNRWTVGGEPEPREVFENGIFINFSTALYVMIFDAEKNAALGC